MNMVVLVGRLTKDIELKVTNSGKSVAQFTIAVDKYSKDNNRQVDFINCVAWGQVAENMSKYLGKGRKVVVNGSLSTRNYDDKNGVKHYIIEVIVNRFEFADSQPKNDNVQAQDDNEWGFGQATQQNMAEPIPF